MTLRRMKHIIVLYVSCFTYSSAECKSYKLECHFGESHYGDCHQGECRVAK
jgi:hypothetical protein